MLFLQAAVVTTLLYSSPIPQDLKKCAKLITKINPSKSGPDSWAY